MKRLSISLLLLLTVLGGCKKTITGHECKWMHCPYKGVLPANYSASILQYIGEDSKGSDSYYIDLLHLENPTLEYDELEELLFSNMRH